MEIIRHKSELEIALNIERGKNHSIGFVPTMGALHLGHLSLIEQSKKYCSVTICSIFVNPTQFNDPKDLERYPRPIEKDIALLEHAGCDILFLPEVNEMYTTDESWKINLGYLETVLEGAQRPGHFQGVTQIVKKLFDAVKPDKAFFGQKDYQQVMVVKELVRQYAMPVQIIACPIVRERDGLAMSSRNIHLSIEERKAAGLLSKALQLVQERYKKDSSSIEAASGLLKTNPLIQMEYLTVCDADTLQPINQSTQSAVALLAARVGVTRLIDNMLLD